MRQDIGDREGVQAELQEFVAQRAGVAPDERAYLEEIERLASRR